MITKYDAVLALVGLEKNFGVTSDDVLEWYENSDEGKPTEEQIQAKLTELQADYDSKQYQRDRVRAYPSIGDQLDNIFHNGIDAWKADIQAIKNQFPKP